VLRKIYVITMPRILGYVFNPLNVYFCYDENNYICDILYEVSNTFGERYEYVFHIHSPEQKNYSLVREIFFCISIPRNGSRI